MAEGKAEGKEAAPVSYEAPVLNLIASASDFVLPKVDEPPKEEPPLDPGVSEAEW